MEETVPATYLLALGSVFTLFFVTLGPIKILGPAAQLTRELDSVATRALAFRAVLVSLVALVVGGFLGRSLLESWHIEPATLVLAGGVVFFLVALQLVLAPYGPTPDPATPLPAEPLAAALRMTFPMVVTPYGVAAVIVLLAASHDAARIFGVLALLLLVLVVDLLALIYARSIMSNAAVLVTLRILGAVLAILQLALGAQLVLSALRALDVLPA